MTAITFDKFEYVKKLKEAGIPEKQAEIQAEAISSAITSSNAASKEDLHKELGTQTWKFIGAMATFLAIFVSIILYGVNSKVDAIDVKFDAKLNALDSKIDAFKVKMDAEFDTINAKLDTLIKK